MSDETLEMEEANFIETASVLLESKRIGYFQIIRKYLYAEGDYSSVSLQDRGEAILAREEKFGDVIGFYHTHPPGCNYMSERDFRTAKAFSESYGKRMVMIIDTPEGWRGAWLVGDDGVRITLKVISIPFFTNYFLVMIP